jgi:hypothetical protein
MSLIRFIAPRFYRQRQFDDEVRALRSRDGDNCARCRRALRFDLPVGHDQGPEIESGHLCHRRCNAGGMDHTGEVADRMRRKAEAALFTKSRKKRRAA